MAETERVGLYGGTFSPPHMGHVNAAEVFLNSVNLTKLVIMPANIPPHKVVLNLVSPEHRLEMCRLSFGNLKKTVISDYEIKKDGVSYTVDTLRTFTRENRKLFLLCGDDMFLTLDTWRNAEEIFKLATIVGIRRYDGDSEALLQKKKIYEEKYSAEIVLIDNKAFPVSSTEIRERISNGEVPSGLIHPDAEKYIYENGLYR